MHYNIFELYGRNIVVTDTRDENSAQATNMVLIVTVYVDYTSLSISSDFWDSWLVQET